MLAKEDNLLRVVIKNFAPKKTKQNQNKQNEQKRQKNIEKRTWIMCCVKILFENKSYKTELLFFVSIAFFPFVILCFVLVFLFALVCWLLLVVIFSQIVRGNLANDFDIC